MKIWKPLMCASLLGMACSLPAQAHGPWTDNYSRSDRTVYADSTDRWDTGTSRDAHGLPSHGAIGTGSMDREWAMSTGGGYRNEPGVMVRPGYAPRDRRMSDDYQMRGY